MKKTKLVAMLVTLFLGATMGAACGTFGGSSNSIESTSSEQTSSGSTSVTQVTVAIDRTEASVDLFASLTLSATVTGSEADVEWTSSNEAIAIVSDDGIVTPVGVGTVDVFATVGEVSAKCTITVTAPEEAIEIVVPYESLNMLTGDTETLEPVGYLGVNELAGGVYTYSSTDETVVTVSEDGVITAVKAGTATIKINGTFKGVSATEVELAVSISDPVTHDKEFLENRTQFIANREQQVQIDLTQFSFTSITGLTIGGVEVEYAIDGKIVTLTKENLADVEGGVQDLVFTGLTETGDITISGKLLHINFAIGTAAELDAFAQAISAGGGGMDAGVVPYTKYMYVILTDNIDYGGKNITDNYADTAYFQGYFDGQGYTINNIKAKNAIFYGINGFNGRHTTFKNVAFTNVVRDTANGGAFLTNSFSNATIENVYVSGRLTSYTGGLFGGLVGTSTAATNIRNCFVNMTVESVPGKYPALVGAISNGACTVDNCYAISSTSNGYMYGSTSNGLYTSAEAFMAEVKKVPDGFNANYWEIQKGMLVFKSAVQYAKTEVALTTAVTDTQVATGGTVEFTVSDPAATLSIVGENTDGITVNGTTVSVGMNVAADTKFKVVATLIDPAVGWVLTAESAEYTVVASEFVTVTNEYRVAKNRAENLVYDLSEYNLTEVTSLTIGGVAVSEFSFENGVITINASKLTNSGNLEVSIAAKTQRGYLTATAKAYVLDFAIGDATELNAFFKAVLNGEKKVGSNANGTVFRTNYMYAVLTADIDYTGYTVADQFKTREDGAKVAATYFNGSIDGQGHTIYNMKLGKGSLFDGVNGYDGNIAVIKNIAFVNMDKNTSSGGGFITNPLDNATLENIYVSGKFSAAYNNAFGGLVGGVSNTSTIKSCVLNVEYTTVGKYYGIAPAAPKTYEPCYVISTTTNGYMYGTVTEGMFTSIDAFKAAVTEVPATFNSEYWTMHNGMLVFKSVLQYVEEGVTITANTEETEFVAGSSIEFTLSNSKAVLSIVGENTDGITVNGNVVTIASNVAAGTKFTVKATLKDSVIGIVSTAESAEYEVITSEAVTIEGEQEIAINRAEALTLDLSAYNVTEITSLTVGNAVVGEYTLAEGILTVNADKITARGHIAISIVAKTATGYLTATAKAYVIDYAIGNVTELNAFFKAVLNGEKKVGSNANGTVFRTNYMYAVLTADIDYTGYTVADQFKTREDGAKVAATYFNGSIDGQGHTIYNMKLGKGSLFDGVNGYDGNIAVIKNIAFVNMDKNTSSGGGFITNPLDNATLENIYVSGKFSAAYNNAFGGLVGGVNNTSTIKSCVLNVEYTTVGKYYGIAPAAPKTYEPCYVISTTTNGYMYGTVTEGMFTSIDAFKAAVTEVPATFNSEYWTMHNGMLVFKSVLQYVEEGVTITANTEETEFVAGSSIEFTLSNSKAVLSIVGENTDGITVNGNVVTIASNVAAGTKFTVKATLKDSVIGIVSTAESAEYEVITSEAVTIEGEQEIAINRAEALTLDLSAYNVTEITSLTVGNAVVGEYTLAEGILTVNADKITARGHIAISIVAKTATGYLAATAKAYVIDYAIGNATELNAFFKAVLNGEKKVGSNANGTVFRTNYMYAVLTADIDYTGYTVADQFKTREDGAKVAATYFNGSIDGQGHTIYNMKLGKGSLFDGVNGYDGNIAVIKNIAFVNMDKNTSSGGGFITNPLDNATLENIYVSGKFSAAYNNAFGGLVGGVSNTSTIKSCVLNVEYTTVGKYYGIAPAAPKTYEPCYVISTTTNGYMYGTVTEGMFTSIDAFKAAVTEVPATFNSEYWTMHNGMLVFKSVLQYVEEGVTITANTEETEFVAGSSIEFTLSNSKAVLSIVGENTDGITVNGNVVTIASNVAAGTKFTVKATLKDSVIGIVSTAESAEYEVITSEAVTIEGEQEIAINRAEALTLDLSAYNVTEITSLTVGNAVVGEYTLAEGILTVNADKITARGHIAISIVAKTATGYLTATAKAYVIDYAIGNVTELNAFFKAIANGEYVAGSNANGTAFRTRYMYAILTDNIDYTGYTVADQFKARDDGKKSISAYFNGVWDGQGYTISNVKVGRGSILEGINGYEGKISVVKNIAFVNVDKNTSNGGGFLTNPLENGTIENVYLSGKFSVAYGGAFGGLVGGVSNTSTIKSCVLNVEYTTTGKYYGVAPKAPGTYENCYVISNTSCGYMYGTETSGMFTSIDAFKAAVTEVPATFNSEYWTMHNGMLVFKSVLQYVEEGVTITANTEETEFVAGSSIEFTLSNSKAVLSIVGENTDGITVNGNVVTIASNVAAGTKFTVKATLKDSVIGIVSTAESAEYEVITSEAVTIEGEQEIAINRAETLTLDLSAYNVTEITSLTVGNTVVGEYTLAEGILTVNADKITARGHIAISIVAKTATGYLAATAKAYVIDYAIGNATELNAFFKAVLNGEKKVGSNANGTVFRTNYMYAVLTADIDYTGYTVADQFKTREDGAKVAATYFNGSIDGQGHTIYNMKLGKGSLFDGVNGYDGNIAVIKNIAFVNMDKNTSSGGGFITNPLDNATLENIYVSGKFSAAYNNAFGGLVGGVSNTSTIKSCVLNVEYTTVGKYYGIAPAAPKTYEPCYVISTTTNGYMYGTVTEGMFTSIDAFKAAVTEVPATFNSEYWTMHNGMLVFKSVLQYVEEGVTITANTEETEFVAGSSIEFTLSNSKAVLSIVGENTDGITVNGNVVTIASNVAAGTKFTVKATLKDSVIGIVSTAESAEYEVITSEAVTIEGEQEIAINRAEALTLDLSAYNVTEITSLTVGNAVVGEYTLAEGILTVNADKITARGHIAISIVAKTATGYLTATAKAYVIDYAIGNVTELNAFFKAIANGEYVAGSNANGTAFRTRYMYAILTDNIDYTGYTVADQFKARDDGKKSISAYFNGVWDGRGYTISNVKVGRGSILEGIIGYEGKISVVKNIAFVNVDKNTSNGGGFLTNPLENGTIENVYLSGKFSVAYGGAFGGLVASLNKTSTIKNCVLNVEYTTTGKYYGVASAKPTNYENCYVISTTTCGYMYGTVTEGMFTSIDAFKAAVTEVPATFNSEYWTMHEGMLVFKSTIQTEA